MFIELWQPIITTLLFGIAVVAIWQTRTIQKREYKHRRLNEIVEWVTKIISWHSETKEIFKEMANKEDVRPSQRLYHAHILEVQAFLATIMGLYTYIGRLSLTFKQGLPEDLLKLMNDLKSFTDFHGAWARRLFADIDRGTVNIDTREDEKQADELALQMEKSASIVLEKIADIKGKEIG